MLHQTYPSRQRVNFFWTELLSKAVFIPFLVVLLLLALSQASSIKEEFSPATSTEIPASENSFEQIPFYR